MKIQITNNSPIPAVHIIGCVGSFGNEYMEICFDEEWKDLKKHVVFYPHDEVTSPIFLKYKQKPIRIPDEMFLHEGLCRYVVIGEGKKRRLVSRTGFMSTISVPETYILKNKPANSTTQKGGGANDLGDSRRFFHYNKRIRRSDTSCYEGGQDLDMS